MAFTLPNVNLADVEKALATAEQLLADLAPVEALLPAQAKTAVDDIEKVLTLAQKALSAL